MRTPKISALHRALLRRYLTWAYKSTKESFDRLERKTTQLMADERILKELSGRKSPRAGRQDPEYADEVEAFKSYIANKQAQAVSPGRHAYLRDRLDAVERTIVHFLGKRELTAMQRQYEAEFTRRIWESRDH